ncbi:iron-containing alcohol dehydrogenase [Streptomyces sp. AC602_WCS936]|uniref:iron-containing alcohol dehydrogenase n=1 Tax=Streptomyces sp. AC602_WCS936 TaxID=2823685 RepID=UPI001C27A8C9|nr:iron-containing alcohol dehydrogenase [Streptomyces sp. AC602_WCS936]
MKLDPALPTRVEFGRGGLDRIGPLARDHGSHALVVTGRTAARTHGFLARALDSLHAAGLRATLYEAVSANPRSDEVDEGAALARHTGCDVVVAIGGGSALDAAKCMAVTARSGGSVRDLVGVTLDSGTPVLPLLAVPTTAGSGSEVTKGAIITDTVRGFRSGVRGEALFPKVAVVDPDLVATLPRGVLAETAFDAFAHAVEGCVSRQATAASRDRAHQAVELITESLPPLLKGEDSPAAREALSRAAVLGGLNVATASTCLPHRLQQAMGSLRGLGISHGRGLAVIYPSWLRHTEPLAAEEFAAVAERLGGGTIHEATQRLLESAGLGSRLRDWGVDKQDLDALVQGVSGNLANDPAPDIDAAYLHALYAESF